MQPLLNCLKDIKTWMDLNFLIVNENKTEIVMFGHPDLLDDSDGTLGPLASYSQSFVKNLGVIFDSSYKFYKQISSVIKTSFS